MISVVIPAHDEAGVIGRLLDALAPAIDARRAEVVVAANGCSDSTAVVASRPGVTVVELERGHKPSALNAGDAAASAFPRFYVDGDVTVSAADLEVMAARLDQPGVEAVAPRLELDTSRCSWVVRSYHRFWSRLPAVRYSLAARGCFGVTESGRSRWEEFPDVVADDQFVNSRFAADEKVIEDSVTSVVVVAGDLRSLVTRKRRSHRGNIELKGRGVESSTSNVSWLRVLRADPVRLLDLPAFVGVTVAVRLAARRDVRSGDDSWGADVSSRAVP